MTEILTAPARNGDFDWDAFDSTLYQQHNYAIMRPDDARILRIARNWFTEAVPAGVRLDGVDVGTGSNLAPALTIALHCKPVTLYEYSAANVAWLRRELADPAASWGPFWDLTGEGRDLAPWWFAKHEFAMVARVQQGSIFDLPKRRWGTGTMFFCAESLTGDPAEFERALHCFLGCLTPGAPFAAAFMAGSRGYPVGDVQYPAVPLTGPMLGSALARCGAADGFAVHRVGIDPAPVRAGYDGYLVATGRAAG